MAIVKAKKDLYNGGKCFSKGKHYVTTGPKVVTNASLLDAKTINDLGEEHTIGSWWRFFRVIKH